MWIDLLKACRPVFCFRSICRWPCQHDLLIYFKRFRNTTLWREVQLWSKIGNISCCLLPLSILSCVCMLELWALSKVSSGCKLWGSRSRTGSGCSPLWPAFWLVEVPLSLSLFSCMLCCLYINICKLKSQVVKSTLCMVWFGKLFADVTSD
jgi:hypothetical protein